MKIFRNTVAAVTALTLCAALTACGDTAANSTPAEETSAAEITESAAETSEEITSAEIAEEEAPLLDVKKLSDKVYSLDFPGDYDLDGYLEADVKTVEELDRWFMENVTNGISTEGSEYNIACSSFAVTDPDGKHLFCRNYDLRTTDAMFIRTAPSDGYSSIGIVDLAHLNIGQGCEADIDSADAQFLLLAAPFCICDGINEKGLGVSLLQLDIEHKVNDTDKHDLLVYIALRALLDKCADADEAVAFLSGYDIFSPSRYSYHIFITDKSGRSVIAEWIDGELTVVEDCAVTNFILYEAPPTRDPDGRYFKLKKALDDNSELTKEEAMELLGKVSQAGGTRWSAVYDLDGLTVEACFNGDYYNKFTFPAERE